MNLNREIERVIGEIRKICDPLRIVLFGSAAAKKALAPNDLDFLIVVPDDECRQLVGRIHCEVERKVIPLDLVVIPNSFFLEKRVMSGSLCSRADDEGVVLYERAPA